MRGDAEAAAVERGAKRARRERDHGHATACHERSHGDRAPERAGLGGDPTREHQRLQDQHEREREIGHAPQITPVPSDQRAHHHRAQNRSGEDRQGKATGSQQRHDVEATRPRDREAHQRHEEEHRQLDGPGQPVRQAERGVGRPPLRPERVGEKIPEGGPAPDGEQQDRAQPGDGDGAERAAARERGDAQGQRRDVGDRLEAGGQGQRRAGRQQRRTGLRREQLIDHEQQRQGQEAHLHPVGGLGERAAPGREGDHDQRREQPIQPEEGAGSGEQGRAGADAERGQNLRDQDRGVIGRSHQRGGRVEQEPGDRGEPFDGLRMGHQRDAAVTGEGARKSQRDCAIIPAVVANDQANSDQRRK